MCVYIYIRYAHTFAHNLKSKGRKQWNKQNIVNMSVIHAYMTAFFQLWDGHQAHEHAIKGGCLEEKRMTSFWSFSTLRPVVQLMMRKDAEANIEVSERKAGLTWSFAHNNSFISCLDRELKWLSIFHWKSVMLSLQDDHKLEACCLRFTQAPWLAAWNNVEWTFPFYPFCRSFNWQLWMRVKCTALNLMYPECWKKHFHFHVLRPS